MKRFLHAWIVGLFVLAFVSKAQAQLTVDNTGANQNPAQLVLGNLLGNGIQVSNITFSGDQTQQIGAFDGSSSGLESNGGVLMATGNVNLAPGPNTQTDAADPALGIQISADPDLAALAGGANIYDAAVLEFDIVPIGNEVVIRYIFASEEYDELVCSGNADVFGIFISGPGIAGPFSLGAENIAVVPNTTLPVSINTINNGSIGANGAAGGCGGAGDPGLNNSQYYVANPGDSLQYDGYTVMLEARATVECSESYHVKIAIADVEGANGIYDSGLFLDGGGMFSAGIASFDAPTMGDSAIVEGCKPAYIFFSRQDSVGDQQFEISINGTADNGVDYTNIDTVITIPDGSDGTFIAIEALADGVAEGAETVEIILTTVNACGDTINKTWDIIILDEQLPEVTITGSDTICQGDQVTIDAAATGGYPPYVFEWTNGGSGSNFVATPSQDTEYALWMYDQAGCVATGSAFVKVNPNPIVNAGNDTSLCIGQPASIGQIIDGYANASYAWTPPNDLSAANVPYPTVTITQSRQYAITVTTEFGCTATDNISVTALPVPTVSAGSDRCIIYGQQTAILGGSGTGTPFWQPATGLSCTDCFEPEANPQESTDYTLFMFHPNGCVVTDNMSLEVIVPEQVFVPTAFSPNGDGSNDLLFVRGYTIEALEFKVYDQWGNEAFSTQDINFGWDGTMNGQPAVSGTYIYTVSVRFVNGTETTKQGDVTLVR